jgi:hypothetical protein
MPAGTPGPSGLFPERGPVNRHAPRNRTESGGDEPLRDRAGGYSGSAPPLWMA